MKYIFKVIGRFIDISRFYFPNIQIHSVSGRKRKEREIIWLPKRQKKESAHYFSLIITSLFLLFTSHTSASPPATFSPRLAKVTGPPPGRADPTGPVGSTPRGDAFKSCRRLKLAGKSDVETGRARNHFYYFLFFFIFSQKKMQRRCCSVRLQTTRSNHAWRGAQTGLTASISPFSYCHRHRAGLLKEQTYTSVAIKRCCVSSRVSPPSARS